MWASFFIPLPYTGHVLIIFFLKKCCIFGWNEFICTVFHTQKTSFYLPLTLNLMRYIYINDLCLNCRFCFWFSDVRSCDTVPLFLNRFAGKVNRNHASKELMGSQRCGGFLAHTELPTPFIYFPKRFHCLFSIIFFSPYSSKSLIAGSTAFNLPWIQRIQREKWGFLVWEFTAVSYERCMASDYEGQNKFLLGILWLSSSGKSQLEKQNEVTLWTNEIILLTKFWQRRTLHHVKWS